MDLCIARAAHRCAAGFLIAALAGCGGGNADAPSPGTPARLSIVSGNRQTVEQHLRLPQDLVVAVTDVNGDPVDGVAVDFAPAPGSPPVATTWPVPSPMNPWRQGGGQTRWAAYLHTAGPHRIVASAAGLPPVTFDVDVTASAHPYDGPYNCRLADDVPSPVLPNTSAVTVMTIVHGVQLPGADDPLLQDLSHFIHSAGVDEATGAMTAGFRVSTDYGLRLAGQMVADRAGQVTGSGTYDLLFRDGPPSLATGTWSCTRF